MSRHRLPAAPAAHRADPPPARLTRNQVWFMLLSGLVLFWLIVLGVVIL